MRTRKPVIRSDGRRYPSIMMAARDLRESCGMPRDYACEVSMAGNISRVCSGKPSCNTAYGYGWEYECC